MKFNLFFVLLSIFAIVALTHPSAAVRKCCKKVDDCVKPPRIGVYCELRIPCETQPDCGTCRPFALCEYPCCLENSDCGGPIGVFCNVTRPCGIGCGTCEPVD